jgi:hypothetical protein
MLTSTYTLVALKIEQAGVRAALSAFQDHARAHYHDVKSISERDLDDACMRLRQLYRSSTWRKVEIFVVPAVRSATSQADGLLADLAGLTYQAFELFDRFEASARDAAPGSAAQRSVMAQLRSTVDGFCQALLKRLEREDEELLPLARNVIAGDAWFDIANHSLEYDARLREQRHAGQPEAAALQLELI